MKSFKIIFIIIILLLGSEFMNGSADNPVLKPSAPALPAPIPLNESIWSLINQLFIHKKINNRAFTAQELNQALSVLNTIQANDLYEILNIVLHDIEKMIQPTIKHIPLVKNLKKDVALEQIRSLIRQLFEIKKTNQNKPINYQLLDLGIKNLSKAQKETLQRLLNIVLKNISGDFPPLRAPSSMAIARKAPQIDNPALKRSATSGFLKPLKESHPQSAHQPFETCAKEKAQQDKSTIAPTAHLSAATGTALQTKPPSEQSAIKVAADQHVQILRDQEAKKIKDAKITDEELKKMLTPADQKFLAVYNAIENNNFHMSDYNTPEKREILMGQDANGYMPLFHAIYKDNYVIVIQLVALMKKQLFAQATNKADSTNPKIPNPGLRATIKGLNAYEFAVFLDNQADSNRPNIRAIKTFIRSTLSAELPSQIIIVPQDIYNKPNNEILAWIDAQDPNNKIFIFDNQEMNDYAQNFIFALFRPRGKTFNKQIELFSQLLARNINVRYELAQMIRHMLLRWGSKFDEVLNRLIHKAIEQGEPIENIEEIYQAIKQKYYTTDLANALQIDFLKLIIETIHYQRELQASEDLLRSTTHDIAHFVLAPSDPKILRIKRAIEDYYDSNEIDYPTKSRAAGKLRKALGTNSRYLLLQDGTGYTPLLYAVYLNKIEAVSFMIDELILMNSAKKGYKEIILKNTKSLEELQTQRADLSKTPEDRQKNAKALDELAVQVTNIKKSIAQDNAMITSMPELSQVLALTTRDNDLKKNNGLNAYCLAQFLGHKEIMELLARFYKDECPK